MLLELSEVLACPNCLPPQTLVVFVEEMRGRRVLHGHLGCPQCESRFPVRRGTLFFGGFEPARGARKAEQVRRGWRGPTEDPGAARAAGEARAVSELAIEVVALLDVRGRSGVILLDEGLAPVAREVVRLAEGAEIMALTAGADPLESADAASAAEDEPPGRIAPDVSRVYGAPSHLLPVQSGRLLGVAFLGGSAPRLREGARVLVPGGRLAILRPNPALDSAVGRLPLSVLASESRALVARRR